MFGYQVLGFGSGGTTPLHYMRCAAADWADTPDTAALDITGDIDLRCKVAMDDWGAAGTFIAKYHGGTNERGYYFHNTGSGNLRLQWSTDGTGGTNISETSPVHNIVNGTTKWVRCTLDVDNGSSNYTLTWYISDDGVNWTDLGGADSGAGVTSIFSHSRELSIGAQESFTQLVGNVYRAQVYDGIAGTLVLDANFEGVALGATSFTEDSVNAATVTLDGAVMASE